MTHPNVTCAEHDWLYYGATNGDPHRRCYFCGKVEDQ